MRIDAQTRAGFALATALIAIVLIGLLIAGTFFGSTQEYRAGRNALYQERALTAAEYGQNLVLTDWNTDTAFAMAAGELRTRTITAQNGATAEVRITKLNMLTFWVVSEGRAAAGTDMEARRRTGMIVRLDVPEMKIFGALTMRTSTGGGDQVGGSGTISGNDVNPAGWSHCAPAGPAAAGIVADDSTKIAPTGATCSNFACVTGSPKVDNEPAFADTTNYFEFGGQSWSDLTASANITFAHSAQVGSANNPIQPYVTGGVCDKSIVYNWGDPSRTTVCANYYPIIWARGDFKIVGGEGQGILLVDGNLVVSGGARFYGPVLVRGTLSTSGTGAHFNGGVLVGNVNRQASSVLGNGSLNFSRCALLSSLAAHAKPTISKRSWADMF